MNYHTTGCMLTFTYRLSEVVQVDGIEGEEIVAGKTSNAFHLSIDLDPSFVYKWIY